MKTADVSDAQVVAACRDWHAAFARDPRAYSGTAATLLAERTAAPAKVVLGAMERAYRRRLIEVGVSLSTAWPTDAGLSLLAP